MPQMVLGAESDDQVVRGQTQEIYIPVHGFVRLFREEVILIDHPAFQRLRHMRQLGFAHLVFPGASHSRFEHALGALFVANKILDHLDENHSQDIARNGGDTAQRSYLFNPVQRQFVRLAALCHDIGHLPFSHTLEDELGHLKKHDGPDRLYEIGRHNWGRFRPAVNQNENLGNLVDANFETTLNHVYQKWVDKLFNENVPSVYGTKIAAFDIFCAIVVKESDLIGKKETRSERVWADKLKEISEFLPVNACRDMIGDTICADFLDYIHRDWYHVGKAIQVDDRLFHYMRVLRPREVTSEVDPFRFVIDVGPKMRVRYDAITLILDLLDSRYKLTETVLFHRTKLGIIALVDRILLEIRELWIAAKVEGADGPAMALQHAIIEQLKKYSDDHLCMILQWLHQGGAHEDAILRAAKHGLHRSTAALGDDDRQADFEDKAIPQLTDVTLMLSHKAISKMQNDIKSLIDRLGQREIYTLAERIDIDLIGGTPSEGNHAVQRVIDLYKIPSNRYAILRAIEDRCGLERGDVLMYCPPNKRMGAKVAKVNLHLDGQIIPFDKYERDAGAAGLTCNALGAQISRFYQLWGVSFYVDRAKWKGMSDAQQAMFRHLVHVLLKPVQDESDATARQTEANALILGITDPGLAVAARSGGASSSKPFSIDTWRLPSGMELPCDGK